MIVIKTAMKKIPEKCNKCPYYVPEYYKRSIGRRIPAHCRITQQIIKKEYSAEKRNWCVPKLKSCPLMKIEERSENGN